ncbi:hypothetical protein LJC08_04220 [Methanimicrococcus sp. OttesenSCG-928-J09]|nr:hypothetical protein [Methanimicrococcus sp. OttesenSCG-928-J09]
MNYLPKAQIPISENIIAETPGLFQKYSPFLIPYTDRKDLTTAEKVCIGNYQDIHFWNTQKQNWSFLLPKIWETKPWCYAVNKCCRDPIF